MDAPVTRPGGLLGPVDLFAPRHIGPDEAEVAAMLEALGYASLDELVEATVPASILARGPLTLPGPRGEHAALRDLQVIAERNDVLRSFIGAGYHDCVTPPVIQRNVLENPGWYTQYTPYQAEIAQGRLEALLNFQTLVSELTALPLANASLLDEATAAAEAMHMCRARLPERPFFFVAEDCHPQTIAVVETRAAHQGIEVVVGPLDSLDARTLCGALVQYPTTHGHVVDYEGVAREVHEAGSHLVVAADPLALTLLRPPGEFGADICVGSAQRFGVPLGFGGPHAAFLAATDQFRRTMPGRIVGVSKDVAGRTAYRLALQTREQHIRRDKATSNICTAQVLLAVVAGMYAVYHGPEGLRRIARRVRALTLALAEGLKRLGFDVGDDPVFDTLAVRLELGPGERFLARAAERRMNLRLYEDGSLGIALDETTNVEDVLALLEVFAEDRPVPREVVDLTAAADVSYPAPLGRTSEFLTHPVFNTHHSEHEMLRYLKSLEQRDLSLTTSMIPLGSCTMKLNATSEMLPISWPEFARIHPFAPASQTRGYQELFQQLTKWLSEITGFPGISLQPNSGAQGEYAGLLTIRAWHVDRDAEGRDVCLIPVSAHGTNPASAVMAGFRVVPVACDEDGNVDLVDLEKRATEHAEHLGALMITYPSTHGVFEEHVSRICAIVHERGGLVYMDGANLNAQVGLTRPADIGADVCHLNLHKTFCIPHGGGGPGMGPIGVIQDLIPYLPGHPFTGHAERSVGTVSAAPWGSAGILPISWMYLAMMGGEGLRRATQVAILSANYMARRLRDAYAVLYTGLNGRVAHEFIVDCRPFKSFGIEVEDVAKRLMDYGFHAPTMSFPVPGTLMIEPTESETKDELDRFVDAMLRIREEIREVEQGRLAAADSPLRHAPHTAQAVTADAWERPYSRQLAAFPAPWVGERKFWPYVGRIDNAYGDRNLVCLCPPVAAYSD